MKYFLTTTFLFLFIASEAAAMCTWGLPPLGREYEPLDATEAFISYQDGVQTLVLQPEWQGDVDNFAIVYPTPSRPEVVEGPVNLFRELNNATNPLVERNFEFDDDIMALESVPQSVEETVVVVEEKQVGEYEVVVLTATDADDLAEWLEDNEYNYTAADAEKVAYYVDQGGFYFIALKVDASHFEPRPIPFMEVDEDIEEVEDIAASSMPVEPDWFWGELSPLQISFATDRVQLPMRTLKSDMPRMTFDLYTLSERAMFVPGVDTIWSNLVDADFLKQVPSLNDYEPKAKWLVRQEINFEPSNSLEDLYLDQVETNNFTTVTAGDQVRFNPSELDSDTGIIAGVRGQVVQTNAIGETYSFVRSLTLGAVGEDVRALQQILNAEGFIVATAGAGSTGNETTYFGNLTKQALIKYQNFYRADILEPVGLTYGTGYFGPSTIAFINR